MEYSLELQKKLTAEFEGLRLEPYKDSRGFYTWGYGRNLEGKGLSTVELIWMITDGPTKALATLCLENDLKEAIEVAESYEPWDRLCAARKLVIVDMIFNLGRLGFSKFKKFMNQLYEGNYKNAAREMVDSEWYKQVGRRGVKLVEMMRSGVYE